MGSLSRLLDRVPAHKLLIVLAAVGGIAVYMVNHGYALDFALIKVTPPAAHQ